MSIMTTPRIESIDSIRRTRSDPVADMDVRRQSRDNGGGNLGKVANGQLAKAVHACELGEAVRRNAVSSDQPQSFQLFAPGHHANAVVRQVRRSQLRERGEAGEGCERVRIEIGAIDAQPPEMWHCRQCTKARPSDVRAGCAIQVLEALRLAQCG